MNMILNEKKYVEGLLNAPSPSQARGKELSQELALLAKYYTAQGLDDTDTEMKLIRYLKEADPTVRLQNWQKAIESHMAAAKKYPLVDVNYIPITQSELDRLDILYKPRLERVAFTLLVMAKVSNLRNPANDNWSNIEDVELFKAANVTMKMDDRPKFIQLLRDKKLVSYSSKVDNLNLRVEFVDSEGKTVAKVKDLRNVGFQYMAICGIGRWTTCANCGITMRKRNNRHCFCQACAKERDRQKALERWRKRKAENECGES